jgi:hypothetical protein
MSSRLSGRLAQLVRARASHARGRGFEPLIAHRLEPPRWVEMVAGSVRELEPPGLARNRMKREAKSE